jgi:hypothetical protein
MRLREFITKIFISDSGVSSKRIFGALGWIVGIIMSIYCTVNGIQAPDILDTVIITSTTLLGVDSITGIWRKK